MAVIAGIANQALSHLALPTESDTQQH